MFSTRYSESPRDSYDLIIVGAGVGGSALAARLGRSGFRVAVIERNWNEPDEIIGELLQPGGIRQLEALGLAHALKGFDAQQLSGYSLFYEGDDFDIPYPGARRAWGYGFRYGKFVSSLRRDLHEVADCLEGRVARLLYDETDRVCGVELAPDAGRAPLRLHAVLTVLSPGASSSLRASLVHDKPRITGYMLGLLFDRGTLPHRDHGHVFIADPAPVLAYPVSSTEARLLIDFPLSKPPRRGEDLMRHLRQHVVPQLHPSMREAVLEAIGREDFKVKPTGLLGADPSPENGAVLIGDTLNIRHPVTGGGMTAALTDVRVLSGLLERLEDLSDKEATNAALARFYRQRRSENATINILADALYQVFCHPRLRRACFDYLRQGGDHAMGPMSILSGLSREKPLLLRHFFSVAFFGVRTELSPLPRPANIRASYRLIRDAVNIIGPLLEQEHPGPATRSALRLGKLVFPADPDRESRMVTTQRDRPTTAS